MLRATLLISSALVLAGCQVMPLASHAPAAPELTRTNAAAQAGLLTPMVERRETLTGTGYAVISVQNHRTAAQQRLMAIRASRLDAYRSLAEQVYGQYLDANTTVADMIVMSDTFRSRVEGVIYGAVLVSITPVGDDTYETTLSLDRGVVEDLRALYLNQLAARRN
jgi:outer membrane protein FlgP